MTSAVSADVVQRLYEALESGDRSAYRALLDPQVEWHFMEGFPHGGVKRGVDAIVDETFTPLMADFEEWHIEVDEIFEAEGAVVGLGRYRVRARSSGRDLSLPYCHVFRLHGGAVVHVQQFTDTVQFAQALTVPP